MSSKKRRQTMEKLRREQAVRRRREDKQQRKTEARAAKASAALDQGSDGAPVEQEQHAGANRPEAASLEPDA